MVRIDSPTSTAIRFLRFPLIVLVVFIHNRFVEVRYSGHAETLYVSAWAEYVRTIISTIIARPAVPLFFLISGYLLYSKNPTQSQNIVAKAKTIAAPYITWTILSLGFFGLAQNLQVTKPFFSNQTNLIGNFKGVDWIDAFAGRFTDRAPYPFIYQFWFLRDLFILNIIFPAIKVLCEKISAVFLTLLVVLWFTGFSLHLVPMEAAFFFSVGCLLARRNVTISCLAKIPLSGISAAYIALIALQIYSNAKADSLVCKINILIGAIFILKMSILLLQNQSIRSKSIKLESYAFFVYASHEPLLTILRKLSVRMIPQNSLTVLTLYFFVAGLTITLSLLTGKLIRTVFPKIYGLLTGERTFKFS